MQLLLAIGAFALAPIILAAPVADKAVDKRQLTNALLPEDHSKYVDNQNSGPLGNIGATLMIGFDHAKYTVDPPSAANEFPPDQFSEGRDAHRKAHLAIYEASQGGGSNQNNQAN
ncbi:hypothetical protein EYZ11_003681 [Aspergillus tanneri]|uniref:Uncharacterized protein n=1 Tax=Aspergillus tanneri TaxID=1220188 RepID=A0A4S3JPT7_9EURO|nr:uncharacterized protein ATNIH1004_006704 [Aspergillus tanneri]KAA8645285.1 hypothetical protein ATNIH1004_006704 [Aspergillus tanneri]THC96857.1 hypothetical protein EYZ11_003681 [Aspergillus tanneri]